ncbi:carboxy-terminal processing protease CtpB precursor [Oxobacter pfennigii]|uniref:Carboxy-terminal processing protease CtpB n=2 Tax=Oxobacter pfennigii TaxID=36849 RepID=A0A0P8YVE3_9CLOT|nr:carboxy-terminal processing protease CtpB precursor [Oxobacter pfennigii]
MTFMNQDISKKRRSLRIALISVIAVLILNLFTFSVQAKTAVLDTAKDIITNYYIEDVSDKTLKATTIEDVIKSLNDPYTQYFTADEYKRFTNDIDGKYSGIGIQIEIDPEGVKVLSVIDGTPAQAVGIKEGDIITKVDNHKLAGAALEAAASYLRGEAGTVVNIQVKRDNSFHAYKITRREFESPTIEGKMLDEHTAYIRIISFGDDTASLFKAKLEELGRENPDNFIVDLRNNGGGYLKTAQEMAYDFIGERPLVLLKDREGKEGKIMPDKGTSQIDKPIIFLVNQYSASASEILSAAVKDYKTAFLVGTTTYGKGTVQSMFGFSDGSVLKLSVERFYSPLGNVIEKEGVTPDLTVGGEDSLAVAELLSGKAGDGWDKRDFMKVKIDSREFEIDLKKARAIQYWDAYQYIMDKALESGYGISIGTVNGWVEANRAFLEEELYRCYYPEYMELSELKSVPVNKVFTVIFLNDVNMESINDKNIELINEASGERVPLKFEYNDKNSIIAVPAMELTKGGIYYFVINEDLESGDVSNYTKGDLVKVSVEE